MLLVIMNRRGKKTLMYFIRQDPKEAADSMKYSNWSTGFAEVELYIKT